MTVAVVSLGTGAWSIRSHHALFLISRSGLCILLRKFLAVRPPLRAAGRIRPLGLTTGTGAPLGTGLLGVRGPRAVFRETALVEMGC